MLNNIVAVGRLLEDPEVKEDGIGKIIIVTPRPYKDEEKGEFLNDYIKCELHGAVSSNIKEYCHKGDIVGIKGSVRCPSKESDITIVADKVTFLSSAGKEED